MTDDLDLRSLHQLHVADPAFRAALRDRVAAVLEDPESSEPIKEIVVLTDEPQKTAPPAKRRGTLLAVAAALLLLVLVVGALRLGGDDDDGQETAAGAGDRLVFVDDFDDDSGAWNPDVDVSIQGGQQRWRVSTPGQKLHLLPRALADRLVDMEVTATFAAVDAGSRVGVECRKGPGNEDYYYVFRLGPDGATIGVLPPEPDAPGKTLAQTDAAVPATPFTLTARCVDRGGVSTLTLLLDGETVLEGTYDEPLPAGVGGLEVQAGIGDAPPSAVDVDRFTVGRGES